MNTNLTQPISNSSANQPGPRLKWSTVALYAFILIATVWVSTDIATWNMERTGSRLESRLVALLVVPAIGMMLGAGWFFRARPLVEASWQRLAMYSLVWAVSFQVLGMATRFATLGRFADYSSLVWLLASWAISFAIILLAQQVRHRRSTAP
jgi:hypothetical protein